MTTYYCPECRNACSGKAEACPFCGHPLPGPVSRHTVNWSNVQVSEIILDDGRQGPNALTKSVMCCLMNALRDAKTLEHAVRLTNAGDVFSAGLDRFDLLRTCANEGSCKDMLDCLVDLYCELAAYPYPSACLIAGKPAGGGFGLAMCCDVSVALDSSYFRIPGGGYRELASVLLPIIGHRRDGPYVAPRIPLTEEDLKGLIGRQLLASEAQAHGLLDAVVRVRADLAPSALKQLEKQNLWPPATYHRPFSQQTKDDIKDAVRRATTPASTRAIVAGAIYEVIRSVEKKL